MSTIDAGEVLASTQCATVALRAASPGIFAGGSSGNHGLRGVAGRNTPPELLSLRGTPFQT